MRVNLLVSEEAEVDESFLALVPLKANRGRGTFGKTVVFEILRRIGSDFTEFAPDCRKATLQAVIRDHVDLVTVIHSTVGKTTIDSLIPDTRNISESTMNKTGVCS